MIWFFSAPHRVSPFRFCRRHHSQKRPKRHCVENSRLLLVLARKPRLKSPDPQTPKKRPFLCHLTHCRTLFRTQVFACVRKVLGVRSLTTPNAVRVCGVRDWLQLAARPAPLTGNPPVGGSLCGQDVVTRDSRKCSRCCPCVKGRCAAAPHQQAEGLQVVSWQGSGSQRSVHDEVTGRWHRWRKRTGSCGLN